MALNGSNLFQIAGTTSEVAAKEELTSIKVTVERTARMFELAKKGAYNTTALSSISSMVVVEPKLKCRAIVNIGSANLVVKDIGKMLEVFERSMPLGHTYYARYRHSEFCRFYVDYLAVPNDNTNFVGMDYVPMVRFQHCYTGEFASGYIEGAWDMKNSCFIPYHEFVYFGKDYNPDGECVETLFNALKGKTVFHERLSGKVGELSYEKVAGYSHTRIHPYYAHVFVSTSECITWLKSAGLPPSVCQMVAIETDIATKTGQLNVMVSVSKILEKEWENLKMLEHNRLKLYNKFIQELAIKARN
jgi:hypothetical protein